MKKFEAVLYHIIGLVVIYLTLALLRNLLSFLLRYWILLIVLVTAIYAAFRYCKSGNNPWWLAKLKAIFLRIKRKGKV